MKIIESGKIQMGVNSSSVGISLRDYFAAKAMQGAIANFGIEDVHYKVIAKRSYEMADAMLAEREKQQ